MNNIKSIDLSKFPEELTKFQKFKRYLVDEYDFIYHLKRRYDDFDYWFRRTFKYFFQRGRRGWAENDTWGLKDYLAKVIYESLEFLANNNSGHPCDYTQESWEEKLKEISKAFKDYYEYEDNWMKRHDELEEQYNVKKIDWQHDDLNKTSNDPAYSLPNEISTKFWEDEKKNKEEILERMKELINIYDALWD